MPRRENLPDTIPAPDPPARTDRASQVLHLLCQIARSDVELDGATA